MRRDGHLKSFFMVLQDPLITCYLLPFWGRNLRGEMAKGTAGARRAQVHPPGWRSAVIVRARDPSSTPIGSKKPPTLRRVFGIGARFTPQCSQGFKFVAGPAQGLVHLPFLPVSVSGILAALQGSIQAHVHRPWQGAQIARCPSTYCHCRTARRLAIPRSWGHRPRRRRVHQSVSSAQHGANFERLSGQVP